MAVRDYQDLFQQASTQLNFLLLSQRNMILVLAFALAFLGFSHTFKNRVLIRLLVFTLMIYSLAVGVVSSIDYLDYIKKTEDELEERDFDDGIELLENWKNWVNFTYALLGVNSLIIIFFMCYELDHFWKKKDFRSQESGGVAGSSWFSVGADEGAFSSKSKSTSKSRKVSKKSM